MPKPVLKFNADGKFRILMISDFHSGPDCNPKLMQGIEALVADTNPDLVLVGGDQCLCKDTPEEVKAYLERILEPVLKRNIPWAHVYGNHDRECGIDLKLEQQVCESIKGCLSESGPEEISGIGNYCLEVLSSKDDGVAYHIWALDSNRENSDYVERFGLDPDTRFVLPDGFGDGSCQASPMFDQVMWYYNESLRREKQAGKKIPAIMYFHVPIVEFCLLYRNPEETDLVGSKREWVCCGELNSGLFMACLQRGDVKGIFCGHEHLNDFQGTYCGITMAYDSCVGYNMSAHDDLRGGRLIELNEDGSFETRHIKLMDLLGVDAMRNPDFFEGGCKYFIRKL